MRLSLLVEYKSDAHYLLDSEWWITDHGVEEANSDAGNMIGHALFVTDMLLRDVLDIINVSTDPYEWDGIIDVIAMNEDLYNNGIDWVEKALAAGVSQEILDVIHEKTDPRMYAIYKLGWSAVRGNNIDTASLSDNNLKRISRGLHELLSEIEDDEELYSQIFHINFGNKLSKRVTVKLEDISTGDIIKRDDKSDISAAVPTQIDQHPSYNKAAIRGKSKTWTPDVHENKLFRNIRNGKNKTYAIHLDADSYVVTKWDRDTDTIRVINRHHFDGPIGGPDAKAALAMARGFIDSLVDR